HLISIKKLLKSKKFFNSLFNYSNKYTHNTLISSLTLNTNLTHSQYFSILNLEKKHLKKQIELEIKQKIQEEIKVKLQ
ncbi:35146_t:CDS:1, partial [Gigaspora margarita]